MRAVSPFYNNNEEMRYEIIKNDDDYNYDSCYDNGKFYYVINASSLSSS